MKGKLIVIEGTDCSGKETQSTLLIKALREEGIQVEHFSFPNYDSPTGKILFGPYQGNESFGQSWFPNGPVKVDPKVGALYYAADRKYNIHKITWLLEHGIHVILDRYVYSNMAHQGCKISDDTERNNMYDWLEQLEFDLLELPKPDIAIFLHMPTDKVKTLLLNRGVLDDNEKDIAYLYEAERSYMELSKKYNFIQIDCSIDDKIRSIEDIHNEVIECVKINLEK